MPGMAVDSANDQGIVTVVWTSDDSPDEVFVQYDEECAAINIVEAGDDWSLPDPDDPATAGCLLALLGPRAHMHSPNCDPEETDYWEFVIRLPDNDERRVYGDTLGRACIAAAETLGRWPGGAA
jgi:hypothetical protein